MSQTLTEWLNEQPPDTELEFNDDGSVYQPIWVIENLIAHYIHWIGGSWSRCNHKYSFHEIAGQIWLATSHELRIDSNYTQILICSSFINVHEYADSKNILQTGIAEATKAGVKVLGNRFGKSLNERTVLKKKPEDRAGKKKMDMITLKKYQNAFLTRDDKTIKEIQEHYVTNIED